MLKTRYRAALALFATLWVVGLALGDLVRGIHLLTEPHAICFEHGEFIEGAEPARAGAVPLGRRQSPAFAEDHSAIGHHVHCAIAAKPANLMWTGAPRSPVVSIVDTPQGSAAFAFDGNDVPQRSILFDAPKQSPPV
jgi:hypothetical protein